MLRSDQFALISVDGSEVIQRYPTNSMQNVMDSFIDFAGDKTLDEDERACASHFLKQASALYGLALPFDKVAGCQMKHDGVSNIVYKKKPIQKSAAVANPHKCFALKGRYPIDTPELIKQASVYFDEHWKNFDPGSRRVYAQNVQKQASIFGLPAGRLIEKFASNSYSKNLLFELEKRAHIADTDAFTKLASYQKDLSVDQFATLLTELDAKHHIQSSYNKSILDPLSSVLADPIEKQATSGQTWEMDGMTYSEEEMRKGLAHPDVIALYGNSLVAQLRNPEVFDTLSDSDKKVIFQYGSVR